VLVKTVTFAKTAEPIDTLFVMQTFDGPKESNTTERAVLRGSDAACRYHYFSNLLLPTPALQ